MRKLMPALFSILVLFWACSSSSELPSAKLKEANKVELQLQRHDGSAFELVVEEAGLLDSLKHILGQPYQQENACGESGSIRFLQQKGESETVLLEGKLFLDANCRFMALEEEGKTKKFSLEPAFSVVLDRFLIPEPKKEGPLAALSGFLGLWYQVEGIGLVSYEEWKEVDENHFAGQSWTLYNAKDTIFTEKIELLAENGEVYYIPTVKQNKGPVRFKMRSLVADTVIFENPEHDFPQIIRYEMGDTLLNASISGTKNGQFGEKVFPLRRLGQERE